MKVKSESEVAQSCLTLSDPMDCSLPGSSIHGIFQAEVLEWGAIAFSDSSQQEGPNRGLCSFDRLWLLIGQFCMLSQPKVRFSVPLVEKLPSFANSLGYFLFCFVLSFTSAASEPSGSLFLHWYSSWTYYRVVPNSPRSHHISPDQTLADSWISAFTANIKITWQEFSQLFAEYLEKLFSPFHCYCLYTCYIPKFSHLLDHSSLLTANSTSGLWVLHPFHTAPRTALLKHTSHLLPSLSCFKSLTACNFFPFKTGSFTWFQGLSQTALMSFFHTICHVCPHFSYLQLLDAL